MKVNWMNAGTATKLTREMTKERNLRCPKCDSFLDFDGVAFFSLASSGSFLTDPMKIGLRCPQCRDTLYRMPAVFRRELEKRLEAEEKNKAAKKR